MQSPRAQTAPSDAYNMQHSDSQLDRWHKRLAAKRAAEAAVPVSYTHLTLPTTPYV